MGVEGRTGVFRLRILPTEILDRKRLAWMPTLNLIEIAPLTCFFEGVVGASTQSERYRRTNLKRNCQRSAYRCPASGHVVIHIRKTVVCGRMSDRIIGKRSCVSDLVPETPANRLQHSLIVETKCVQRACEITTYSENAASGTGDR